MLAPKAETTDLAQKTDPGLNEKEVVVKLEGNRQCQTPTFKSAPWSTQAASHVSLAQDCRGIFVRQLIFNVSCKQKLAAKMLTPFSAFNNDQVPSET